MPGLDWPGPPGLELEWARPGALTTDPDHIWAGLPGRPGAVLVRLVTGSGHLILELELEPGLELEWARPGPSQDSTHRPDWSCFGHCAMMGCIWAAGPGAVVPGPCHGRKPESACGRFIIPKPDSTAGLV